MLLKVLTFPDPILRKKAAAVPAVTPGLRILAENMLETMYASRGIGLAAPQVGELVRLLVLDTRPKDDDGHVIDEEMTELERAVQQPIAIFNPTLVKAEGKNTFEEGCLSVPTYYETVTRANEVVVEGLDTSGHKLTIHTDGLLAICLQHEMDHLEGKLFIDRLSLVKSNRIKSKIKKFGYPERQRDDDAADEDHQRL